MASRSLIVSKHLKVSCSKDRIPPGELVAGGWWNFVQEMGGVRWEGTECLEAQSCLEHHGSLQKCPGFWVKMKNTDIKKRFVPGFSFQSDLPFSSIGLKPTQLFIKYLPSDSIIWSV